MTAFKTPRSGRADKLTRNPAGANRNTGGHINQVNLHFAGCPDYSLERIIVTLQTDYVPGRRMTITDLLSSWWLLELLISTLDSPVNPCLGSRNLSTL